MRINNPLAKHSSTLNKSIISMDSPRSLCLLMALKGHQKEEASLLRPATTNHQFDRIS